MDSVERVVASWGVLPEMPVAAVAAICACALILVRDRRWALVPLAGALLCVGLLSGVHLLRPVALLRLGLVVASAAILWVTARHVHRVLASAGITGSHTAQSSSGRDEAALLRVAMGAPFRTLVVALGALITWRAFEAFPLTAVPPGLTLAGYSLMILGALLLVLGGDVLQMGYSLLCLITGFEALYLYLERSLLVISLFSLLDVVLALGIALCAERQFATISDEAGAP